MKLLAPIAVECEESNRVITRRMERVVVHPKRHPRRHFARTVDSDNLRPRTAKKVGWDHDRLQGRPRPLYVKCVQIPSCRPVENVDNFLNGNFVATYLNSFVTYCTSTRSIVFRARFSAWIDRQLNGNLSGIRDSQKSDLKQENNHLVHEVKGECTVVEKKRYTTANDKRIQTRFTYK